jgi:hypothetical protein
MDRQGLNAQNMVISIPLRSIPMTMFNLNSFVKVYADFYRKSISLLTERLNRGENLCLTGWVLNDKDQIFSHESVLACLLEGNYIWE